MTDRPDKFPDWAIVAQNDPISNGPNIVEPPDAKKETGWFYKEFPPSSWWNWLANLTSKWLHYFDEIISTISDIYATKKGVRDCSYNRFIATNDGSNNYSITSTQIDEIIDGTTLYVQWNVSNSGPSTLSINGGTSYPIKAIESDLLFYDLQDQELNGTTSKITFNEVGLWEYSPNVFGKLSDIQNGIDKKIIVKPSDVKSYVDNSNPSSIKIVAAIAFNDKSGTMTTLSSYNATVSRIAGGKYHISFTSALSNTNYYVQCSSEDTGSSANDYKTVTNIQTGSRAVNGLTIEVLDHHNDIVLTYADTKYTSVIIYK